MADTILSPNMNLPVPTVSTDTGPDWANNLNSCLSAIDSHDHTPGKGVPLTSGSFSIISDFSLAGNSLTNTKSVVFQAQSSLTTLDAIYVSGVDLYYNDGSGNVVRITSGGSVAGSTGTITGLPSGTASASYQSVGGTFRFQSATNTPANISGASLLLSEQVASPNFITLASPTSLASAYTVTFPTGTPAATSIVQMSTAGTLSAALVVDNSSIEISSNTLRVKAGGITGAMLNSAVVDNASLQLVANVLSIKDAGVTNAKIQASPAFSGAFSISGQSSFQSTGSTYTIGSNADDRSVLLVSYGSGAGAGQRIVAGSVNGTTGATTAGNGFDCVRNSAGVYTVTWTVAAASSTPIVIPVCTDGSGVIVSIVSNSTTAFVLHTAGANHNFDFIAIMNI